MGHAFRFSGLLPGPCDRAQRFLRLVLLLVSEETWLSMLLLSTWHGLNLMVIPFVLGDSAGTVASHHHEMMPAGIGNVPGLEATLMHTLAYLLVTSLIAMLVYSRLGLRLLRTHWINLDLIWAGALILTGLITPFI